MTTAETTLPDPPFYAILRWRIVAEEPLAHEIHSQILGVLRGSEFALIYGDMAVVELLGQGKLEAIATGMGALNSAHMGFFTWALSPPLPRLGVWSGLLPPTQEWAPINAIASPNANIPSDSAISATSAIAESGSAVTEPASGRE
jgi:hypothetical protein